MATEDRDTAAVEGPIPLKLLDVRDLRIGFNGEEIVHGISFHIKPHEKVALVGESGSGKSVSAMSLLRLIPGARVSGQALYGDTDLLKLREAEIRAVSGKDISMIFQEPMTALNPLHTIGDQIAEVYRLKRHMGRKDAWKHAVARLAETGIAEPERRANAYPHQLSGGQRQRAMIAMALAGEPKLLLADEPTTALDVTLRLQILELLSALQRKNGLSILLITHDLHLVRRFADRVIVMEAGNIVEVAPTEQLFQAPGHPYTRQLINSRPQRDIGAVAAGDGQHPRLEGKALHISYPISQPGINNWFRRHRFQAVKDADVVLQRGQTLGVIGESGSGKSTLASAVLGLIGHEGSLLIDGQSWQQANAHSSLARRTQRRKIQAVFQDPFSSLSPRLDISQVVGEGLHFHHPELSARERERRIIAMLAEVGLSEAQFPGLLRRYPHEFSGGQRQRIAIARALIINPDILVLDEPTSALDVTIQRQIITLLQRQQREHGLSYLIITHDVAVVAAMAHRIIVMKEGNVVESGDAMTILSAPLHPYTRSLILAAA
ncbi:ABC transporter ATP-binding protein [Acerihabitans arboris]|uniref:ABC-type dipeptide transporter n=1 Tax=Acerihabitans arboris TaxID=2691583 RepID=A0A845SQP1_9GAMM|nr:dipeptide ABC transporter ATP-binding protein [Acerihabitans arboris]NDL65216.1 dipeptide ABC transporter ATP-binding protein [Acerihabitans arboris]